MLKRNVSPGRVVLYRSATLFGQRGCIGSQQIQLVGPELFNQLPEPAHAFGIQPVVPVPALFPRGHQAGLLEQEQMLGDGGTADCEMGGQLPHRLFALSQQMQQPAPVWLRSNLQGIQHKEYVSRH